MTSLATKLDFARAGAETKRFHTAITLQENKVGHHSGNVAMIIHFLTPTADPLTKAGLLLAALKHDLAEHKTGDLPAPGKREMGLREQFGAYEDKLMDAAGIGFRLNPEHTRLLKLADAAEGALFCASERMLGNKYSIEYYYNFYSYVREVINPDEQLETELLTYIEEKWAIANG